MPVEFTEGTKLSGLDAALKGKLPQILNAIGAYLVSRSQTAFKVQGFDNKPWQERGVPNVPGIVNDLNKGGSPKARRFKPRPALLDTGVLRLSITHQVRGDSVVVGTTIPYASVHQNGGMTKPVELTSTGREGLANLLRRKPELRDDLGWLFNQPLVFRRVPARPFVGIQDGDLEEIKRIVLEVSSL